MKKIIFTIIWVMIYSTAGIYAETNQLITHPAYWSAFGTMFGLSLPMHWHMGKTK